MIVSAIVGKICHTAVHICLASCIDPVCPVFLAYLLDRNVADFVDNSSFGLKGKRKSSVLVDINIININLGSKRWSSVVSLKGSRSTRLCKNSVSITRHQPSQ